LGKTGLPEEIKRDPCQDKNESDVKLPSNIKKTNVCESVEDGYVIVKVENFDDDVAVHEKSEPTYRTTNLIITGILIS
jgi:hypothetical protein